MIVVNSRAKGCRGELGVAALLKEYGYTDARRGQQYCGANGDSDVVGLPGVHIEAKWVEALNVDEAMAQAIRDARSGDMPAVFHRKNKERAKERKERFYRDWKVTLRAEDFLRVWSTMTGEQQDYVRGVE